MGETKNHANQRTVVVKGRRPGIRVVATFQHGNLAWKIVRVVIEGANLYSSDLLAVRVLALYDALYRKWPSAKPGA